MAVSRSAGPDRSPATFMMSSSGPRTTATPPAGPARRNPLPASHVPLGCGHRPSARHRTRGSPSPAGAAIKIRSRRSHSPRARDAPLPPGGDGTLRLNRYRAAVTNCDSVRQTLKAGSPTMRGLSMASSPRLSGAEQPVLALSVLRRIAYGACGKAAGSCPRRAPRTWERPAAVGRLAVQPRFRAARNAARRGYRSGHDGDADHLTCQVRAARGLGACWWQRPGRTRS